MQLANGNAPEIYFDAYVALDLSPVVFQATYRPSMPSFAYPVSLTMACFRNYSRAVRQTLDALFFTSISATPEITAQCSYIS